MPLMTELTDGGGGGPASTMDLPNWQPTQAWYKTQVTSEPGYQAWQTGADAARVTAGINRKAAIRALAAQYGGLPAGYTDVYGDLDPATLAIDKANPNSQLNQLAASYATQQQQLQTGLAARGALHSGDLVYGQDQLAGQYASNLQDAANAFLGAPGQGGLQGAVADYTQAYNDAYSGQGDAINQAIQALEAQYPAGVGGDTQAQLDPNWQQTYGIPVYSAPDGSLYQVGPDGNLVPYDNSQNRQLSGGGGGTPAPAPGPSSQYPSGTYTIGGVTYDASTGLPVGASTAPAPPAGGYSNLVYYGGGHKPGLAMF